LDIQIPLDTLRKITMFVTQICRPRPFLRVGPSLYGWGNICIRTVLPILTCPLVLPFQGGWISTLPYWKILKVYTLSKRTVP
jgi:hypothetical protein